ncbi:MAG: glycosyltransferase [Deltaproteobacteria bacterium]|nr:MAG: glycosyltransferase [Deltaproteobacteria bacterium]
MTRDVVFSFATETLDDAVRRGFARPPDRLLRTLADEPGVSLVLAADPTRWFASRLRRPLPSGLPERVIRVRSWRLRRREASDLDAVRRDVARREHRLFRAARRTGSDRPAVVSFDPLLAAFGDFDWCGPVTFYARDDWSTFGPRRAWWPAYEEAYRTLRARRRGIVAVSGPLLERLQPTGPAAVVPNGVEPAEWRAPAPPPAWCARLPRPLAVYAGTVDDRVDPDLVRAAADVAGSVLLLGPTRGDTGALFAHDRVHGAVAADRRELAAIVAGADVGLVPHRVTRLTEAMSPLKLYEYRAAGLPVASVDLPPVAHEAAADDAIVCAPATPGDFAHAVSLALERGRDPEPIRLSRLEELSWRGRHRRALEIVLR